MTDRGLAEVLQELLPPKGEEIFPGDVLPALVAKSFIVMDKFLRGKEVLEHELLAGIIRCRPHLVWRYNPTERAWLLGFLAAYREAGLMEHFVRSYNHAKRQAEIVLMESMGGW